VAIAGMHPRLPAWRSVDSIDDATAERTILAMVLDAAHDILRNWEAFGRVLVTAPQFRSGHGRSGALRLGDERRAPATATRMSPG